GVAALLAIGVGLTIRQIGYWHDSIAMWNRVLAVDPANAAAYSNLSIRSHLKGDLPMALSYAKKAATLGPDVGPFWQNYGAFVELAGRMDDALDAHRRGADVAPADINVVAEYAATLARAGRRDESEAQFRRALEIDPVSAKALAGLGALI